MSLTLEDFLWIFSRLFVGNVTWANDILLFFCLLTYLTDCVPTIIARKASVSNSAVHVCWRSIGALSVTHSASYVAVIIGCQGVGMTKPLALTHSCLLLLILAVHVRLTRLKYLQGHTFSLPNALWVLDSINSSVITVLIESCESLVYGERWTQLN